MGVVVSIVALAIAAATAVRGAEPGADLDVQWDAPAGCGDAEMVREHARRRLGASVEASVVARGRVWAIDDATWGLLLEVETRRGRESREIRASSCTALAEAAGLLIAVAIDPAATPAPTTPREPTPPPSVAPPSIAPPSVVPPSIASPSEPGPPPGVEPSRVVPRTTTDRRAPPGGSDDRQPPRTRLVDGAVRAEAGARFARVLPRPVGATVGGAAVLRFAAARLELRAQHAFGQPLPDPQLTDVGGRFSLTTGALVGCWAPRRRRIEIPLCGGIEIGAMRGRSFGVANDGDASSLFAALPIETGVIVSPIPRVGLVVLAGLAPTLRRPSFHLRDRDPLFVAGALGVRLVAGVELRFP